MFLRHEVHSIYQLEIENMVFTHERRSPQHILIRVGANIIFTRKIGNIAFIQELEATAFTRGR